MSRLLRRAARACGLVLALALTSTALLAPAPAAAQVHPEVPAGSPPDVPAGPAAIRGRVVHPTNPAAAAGLEVALYALRAEGMPGLRRTLTDAEGRFAFEGIANDENTAYLVGARFGDVPFPGERVAFQPGETERALEIRVADATLDPSAVSVGDASLRIERAGAGLSVTEVYRLRNGGTSVVHRPKDARGTGADPAFRTTLPPGARDLTHPLGLKPEGLVHDGDAIRFYGPVYPGEQELSFGYTLPFAAEAASGGEIVVQKRFDGGAARVALLAPAEGPPIAADRTTPAADVTIEGRAFKSLETKALAPGSTVAVRVTLPPLRNDPNALTVEEARLFVELDDAVLLAREEYRLRVDGTTALASQPDAPLLVIPLPEGAEDLRFASESAGFGLAPDPRGLAVLGPIGPGEAVVEIGYRMPVTGGSVALDRTFSRATPLLSIYLADTGLLTESERLHRRRPVRTEDRAYVHLEAFDVGAGETVPLRITPLPPRQGVPNALAVVLVLAAAGAAAAWLSGPLLGRAGEGEAEPEREVLLLERDSVYSALRDLEDDFATGKLSDADYATMRAELRARAVALLQAEREAEAARAAAPEPAAPAAMPRCGACGHEAQRGDLFCGRCGARLEAERREASA